MESKYLKMFGFSLLTIVSVTQVAVAKMVCFDSSITENDEHVLSVLDESQTNVILAQNISELTESELDTDLIKSLKAQGASVLRGFQRFRGTAFQRIC